MTWSWLVILFSSFVGGGRKVVKEDKDRPTSAQGITKKRQQVIPYIHQFSHTKKKIVGRFDVPVVFSAPKLSKLCPRVVDRGGRRNKCAVKHRNNYVECTVGVIYQIP